jgi:5-formyltetrahydrofolate cyclo-ligase
LRKRNHSPHEPDHKRAGLNQSDREQPEHTFRQGTADKRALRAYYTILRNALDDEFRRQANAAIQAHVMEWLSELAEDQVVERRVVGLYRAHRGEVNLFPLVDALIQSGWVPAFPVTNPESKSIAFFKVNAETEWKRGTFGIWEPADGQLADLAELGILLVPGVAFTTGGLRLGYGGGYYDRLFATPRLNAIRVGVAYSCQVADSLPVEPHDVSMHYVVTERGVVRCE